MRKDKTRHLILVTFSFLVMILFSSCIHVQSTPNSSSIASAESSASPTANGMFSSIRTYKDLDTLANEDPAKIDNSNFPITPVEALRTTIESPPVDMAKYKLSVDGLVNSPISLSYDTILKEPVISEVVLLICPGVFVDNAEWTGVPVTTLLTEAGIKPEATQVTFYALDWYEYTFSLQDVRQDGVFLAHTVNGQTLPKDHGYPIRLVIKGKYGSNWVKWVNRLEIK
jgi:DMSO/TMAO reductase YedYZ molybdopterin-dependent catalytic subunit